MIMENQKTFTYRDSKNVEHTVSFQQGDFALSQINSAITDVKMKSKPTTFFKDALHRFVKNKSSVAGGVILGVILLLTIFVPIFDQNDISTSNAYLNYQTKLSPKLFDAGSGFWDGTREYNNIPINFDWEAFEKDGTYSGTPVSSANSSFSADAIVGNITYSQVGEKKIDDSAVSYAHGGYIRLTATSGKTEAVYLESPETSDLLYLNSYDYTLDVETADLPEDFGYGEQGSYSINLLYRPRGFSDASVFTLAENLSAGDVYHFDLSSNEDFLSLLPETDKAVRVALQISLAPKAGTPSSLLIKTAAFGVNAGTMEPTEEMKENLSSISCLDAAAKLYETVTGEATRFTTNGEMRIYHADYVTGSFRYDDYAAVYNDQIRNDISATQLNSWSRNGWLTMEYPIDQFITENPRDVANQQRFIAGLKLTESGVAHCPLRIDDEHAVTVRVIRAGTITSVQITGTISPWRLYGYNSSPRFLFGTDDRGRDMFKLVFTGLRYSVILGVTTTIINLAFGLVWGAISGYFGGWVDIVMERVCDILGGVPWVVVMTLILINKPAGMSTIVMLGIALCATGWLSTSSLTRTQFYRYKDREYILAARTLGANDGRLIFRHILPNAIGTLITSSVLMIPSVIFSEASLTYLGLINGMEGFGATLTANQQYMTTYPYLIVFPSVVMALVMISFNLFGNGLRDAFNPSLKGGE